MSRYVGVDLHRRRSQVVILDGDGVKVSSTKVDNRDPAALVDAVAAGGEGCDVVVEATWGWYWVADLLSDAGFVVHLAHPLGVKGFENRRVKNDDKDATLLADLLRMGSLPEAWIAPPELRELRELVRYRRKLSQLRTGFGVPPVGRTRLLCGQGVGVVTVVVLPFDWCLVSDDGAETAAVVPGFDPVTDRDPGLSVGTERRSIDEFFLQRGEERFDRGVVPAHPGSTHGLGDTVSAAQVAVFA
jgi:Transposase